MWKQCGWEPGLLCSLLALGRGLRSGRLEQRGLGYRTPGLFPWLWEGKELLSYLQVILIIISTLSTLALLPSCGKRWISGRIFNAQNAKSRAWPWQVSVRMYGSHICGGSLISESWVVSAAHCVDPPVDKSAYWVQLGETRLVSETPTQTFSLVKRNILHPNYNSSTLLADIAVVELEKPIVFRATISPVCLLDASVRGESDLYLLEAGKGMKRTQQQKKVPGWSNRFSTPSSQGVCGCRKADSGGPLVCEEDRTWYLAGIVSWGWVREVNGVLTISPGYPGVYNRPNAHNDWIQENVPGVTFKVVNFPPSNTRLSIIVTPNGAGPSATIPRVLLLAVLLRLTL
uniref:Peptidase S1 domain-containing protein n=1 Tax=Chelydra serpentina TaxID=8475 RepID=A0A8C3TCF9_CHESE